MWGVLCTTLVATSVARSDVPRNPCLAADAATAKQIQELEKTKQQRRKIFDPSNLKPWIETVKSQSKTARASTNKGLETCVSDQELGPRARRAAVSRLRSRLRVLDETDQQMLMMHAFERDPRPQVDTTILEMINPPVFPIKPK